MGDFRGRDWDIELQRVVLVRTGEASVVSKMAPIAISLRVCV